METLHTKPKENFAFPSGQWEPDSSASAKTQFHRISELMILLKHTKGQAAKKISKVKY